MSVIILSAEPRLRMSSLGCHGCIGLDIARIPGRHSMHRDGLGILGDPWEDQGRLRWYPWMLWCSHDCMLVRCMITLVHDGGSSASSTSGNQVDGLPLAPSNSQSSHCFPSEASARRVIMRPGVKQPPLEQTYVWQTLASIMVYSGCFRHIVTPGWNNTA